MGELAVNVPEKMTLPSSSNCQLVPLMPYHMLQLTLNQLPPPGPSHIFSIAIVGLAGAPGAGVLVAPAGVFVGIAGVLVLVGGTGVFVAGMVAAGVLVFVAVFAGAGVFVRVGVAVALDGVLVFVGAGVLVLVGGMGVLVEVVPAGPISCQSAGTFGGSQPVNDVCP